MKKIETEKAPKAIGPYSQAVEAGGFLFVSGQIPLDPTTGQLASATIQAQTKQVLDNLENILKAAGLSWKNVVRCEVFLKDLQDFKEMNTLYAERFPHEIKPARQTVQVARLPMDSLIEISCIATRS
jgi:2-iminobutanoate/2-iminopropanoate deaminase